MPLISWSDKFSIGIEDIDLQHQKLFHLANKLYDLPRTSQAEQAVMDSLDELIDYTKYHFLSEEKLMQNKDYPRFNAHKIEHDKLTQQAIDFRIKLTEGKPVDMDDFIKFLYQWLTKHIMDQDKKIGAFLQLKKMKPYSSRTE